MSSELDPWNEFINAVNVSGGEMLEMGTRQWNPGVATHRKALFPGVSKYVMTDVQPGADVDVCADAHELSAVFGKNRFDAIVASSVWEHLRKPWIASEELVKTLKPGGRFFVQTHFIFPLHGYPHDYTRWTADGLAALFDSAINVVSYHEFPARIHSSRLPGIENNTSVWLNVCVTGQKP